MHQVIEFYEQNLQIARATGDRRGEMSALGSLGRAYEALCEHGKAIECYEQALKIAREVGDARSERHALRSLSEMRDGSEDSPDTNRTAAERQPSKKKARSSAASERDSSARKLADKQAKNRRSKATARRPGAEKNAKNKEPQ